MATNPMGIVEQIDLLAARGLDLPDTDAKAAPAPEADGVQIEAPPTIEALRSRLRRDMTAQGTWGTRLDPAAWAESTDSRHAIP